MLPRAEPFLRERELSVVRAGDPVPVGYAVLVDEGRSSGLILAHGGGGEPTGTATPSGRRVSIVWSRWSGECGGAKRAHLSISTDRRPGLGPRTLPGARPLAQNGEQPAERWPPPTSGWKRSSLTAAGSAASPWDCGAGL